MTENYLLTLNVFGTAYAYLSAAFLIIFLQWRKTYHLVSSRIVLAPPLIICALISIPALTGTFINSVNASGSLPASIMSDIAIDKQLFNLVTYRLCGSTKDSVIMWLYNLSTSLFILRWIYLDNYKKGYKAIFTRFILILGIVDTLLALGLYFCVDFFYQKFCVSRVSKAS